MATMAPCWVGDVRLEDVEENLGFVTSGVRFANRAAFVVRVAWKVALFLTAFDEAIKNQGNLIDRLNGPATQHFSMEQLNDLAGRIEHLVQVNDDLLRVAAPRHHEFEPWMKLLKKVQDQRDTLESIAESLRSATDPEYQALLVMALEAVQP